MDLNEISNETSNKIKVHLTPVDRTSWKECVDLSVSCEQESFVAENWYSLLEWKFSDNLYPYCVYAGDDMIGFLMYGLDPEKHRWELCRFMIDERHQGMGYGRDALNQLLDMVRSRLGDIAFYTSVDGENKVAGRLYENAGFVKTGEILRDEDVMRIIL